MKKFALFTMLVGCFVVILSVAHADGAYVRKKIKPNFFMPEENTVKRENLPAFPALEKGILKVSDNGVVLIRKTVTNYVPSENEKKLPMPATNSYVKNNAPTYTSDEGMGDDFSKSERYAAIQKSYENDLQIIAQTGEIPQNELLLKDLQKMNSEMPFRVK